MVRFQRNNRQREDTFFAFLYQDALSLPVLHDRLPSTDKILFAFRPFYKRSQRWMTPTKKVQMHKESTNAQRWNVCTIEIRMHASDGMRAEKDKCKVLQLLTWLARSDGSSTPLSRTCVFSIITKMLRNNTISIFYHPRKVQR